ncbi:endonuclease [Pontibacter brevis]
MPEGPQMAYLKEQTEQFIGQPVLNATGSARHIPFDLLIESVLTDIKTFGKEILFCFSDFTIRVHLMLFGKYAINGALNRELRFGLELDTGEINFYACDVRFIYQPLDLVYDWSTDVMHPTFDSRKALKKLAGKPKLLISEALLDQGILAGVGNIIKNEALFRRRIHPASQVGEIPEKELLNLITECVRFSFE